MFTNACSEGLHIVTQTRRDKHYKHTHTNGLREREPKEEVEEEEEAEKHTDEGREKKTTREVWKMRRKISRNITQTSLSIVASALTCSRCCQ